MLTTKKQDRTFVADYDDPVYRSNARELTNTYLNKEVGQAMIGREFATDSFLLHHDRWQDVIFNPKTTSPWAEVLQQYYETDDYKRLNENVSGDGMLAKLATLSYLDEVIGVAQDYANSNPNLAQSPQQNPGQQQGQGQQSGQSGNNGQQPFNVQQFFNQVGQLQQGGQHKNLVAGIMGRMQQAGKQAAQETAQLAAVAVGFSHFGLPILKFGDPNELRATLSSKVVVALLKVLKKIGSSDGGNTGAQPSPRRGIPIGAKGMRSYSEIPDILPVERLNPTLFSYRLINKKVQVRERYSSMSDYLVYLDVSGSMNAGSIKIDGEYVPNISYAAACVIAMALHVSRNGGSLVMKPFGSVVYDEIRDKVEIVKKCLTLEANDGTNLQRVMEDSLNYKDYKIIIVSDGIDHIGNENVIKRAVKGKNDIKTILLNASAPQLEKYMEVLKVKDFAGNFLMKV